MLREVGFRGPEQFTAHLRGWAALKPLDLDGAKRSNTPARLSTAMGTVAGLLGTSAGP